MVPSPFREKETYPRHQLHSRHHPRARRPEQSVVARDDLLGGLAVVRPGRVGVADHGDVQAARRRPVEGRVDALVGLRPQQDHLPCPQRLQPGGQIGLGEGVAHRLVQHRLAGERRDGRMDGPARLARRQDVRRLAVMLDEDHRQAPLPGPGQHRLDPRDHALMVMERRDRHAVHHAQLKVDDDDGGSGHGGALLNKVRQPSVGPGTKQEPIRGSSPASDKRKPGAALQMLRAMLMQQVAT